MKNALIGTFIAILILIFLQPLLETFNVLTQKVELGAAILNSCRAARNNALMDAYDGYGEQNIGDLDAHIDPDAFTRFFAQAFEQTLNLTTVSISDDQIRFESNDGHWNEITIFISWEYDDTYSFGYDFIGRGMSRATLEVETPYVLRTNILRAAVGGAGFVFNITETRTFIVQIIN